MLIELILILSRKSDHKKTIAYNFVCLHRQRQEKVAPKLLVFHWQHKPKTANKILRIKKKKVTKIFDMKNELKCTFQSICNYIAIMWVGHA